MTHQILRDTTARGGKIGGTSDSSATGRQAAHARAARQRGTVAARHRPSLLADNDAVRGPC